MSDSIKILIDKYLQGECSLEEEQQLLHWLEKNDLEAYASALPRKISERKMQKGWETLTRRFSDLQTTKSQSKERTGRRWLVAAVSVGIIFLGALAAFWGFSQTEPQYATNFGELKRIVLPDGTNVTLNAQSSITLNENFNKSKRVVTLSGQAFFKVKQEANCPFIVKTEKINIKVLGTSFDVSAFENESDVSVALKEGKVLIQSSYFKTRYEKGVLLKPGEEAVIGKKTSTLRLREYDKKAKQAWKRQDIYFKDAGMEKVLHKLQRFYGVSFDTTNLRERYWQLSGEYQNQTLKEVLESLSFNYEFNFKIENKNVILYDKNE